MKEFLIRTLSKLINADTDSKRIDIICNVLKQLNLQFEIISIKKSLGVDPDFTKTDELGQKSIRIKLNNNSKDTIILNTHFDTVPASAKMSKCSIFNNTIYGRGSCDALGQVVLVLGLLKKIHNSKNKIPNIIIHFANCEETGGNGTLSLLQNEQKANFAIVFEPTNFVICNACRGALWFTVDIYGKSTHMGKFNEGDNAIYKTTYIILELNKYWKSLIKESKNHIYFRYYPLPIQLNIGKIQGGLINSTLPNKVTFYGAIGFLSNKNVTQIKNELKCAIERGTQKYLKLFTVKSKKHYNIYFNSLHNNPYEIKENKYLSKFISVCSKTLVSYPDVKGFPASCDSRLFVLKKNIPTIVFGPGDLSFAHSDNEFINLRDIIKAINVVENFIYSILENDI
ncbi:MAG: M20/M25/M40 family metallo-hydrolase [archaeon]